MRLSILKTTAAKLHSKIVTGSAWLFLNAILLAGFIEFWKHDPFH